MVVRIRHTKVVTTPDNPSKQVSSGEWNADHTFEAEEYKLQPAGYNHQTGTTYTLASSDNGRVVILTNTGGITLTVPSGLAVGYSVLIAQGGTGQVTVVAGSGVSVNGFSSFNKLAGRYACALIFAPTVNNFILTGTISA